MKKVGYMFQNDEHEKERHRTVHEECLMLIKTLQITFILCFSIAFENKNFGAMSLLDKKVFQRNKLSDKSLSASLIVRKFSVSMYTSRQKP